MNKFTMGRSVMVIFAISLFLSTVVLGGNNGEGGPIPLKYQSVDGIIYDQYGNRYVLEGTFKYTDVHGNIIEKDCAGTEFITEPGYDWGENWHKYTSGSIAGHECKKVPVSCCFSKK